MTFYKIASVKKFYLQLDNFMPHIQTLVDTLTHYKALPHHQDIVLANTLKDIQNWQKKRIKQSHQDLFNNPKTAPLADYLIHRIYSDDAFDVVADQLLTAGQKAQDGSGRLRKLIPQNVLATGVLGVQAAILAVELDLNLAKIMLNNPELYHLYQNTGVTWDLIKKAYPLAHQKQQRVAQTQNIEYVCKQSYHYFNSFLVQKAFDFAKNTAYEHGYQPLYDFIHDGLAAIKHIKKISDFTDSYTKIELATLDEIYQTN